MKRSHYAASLHDPWGVRGARIPDERVVPTATVTSVFRGTLTSFASLDGSYRCGVQLRLGNLIPTGITPGDAGKPIIYAQPGTSGTQMVFSPVPATNPYQYDYPNSTALAPAADRLRVVSAGVALWPTVASTQNSGRIILSQYFGQDNGSATAFNVTDFVNRSPFFKNLPCEH